MSEQQKLSPVEKIKTDSQGLRGTLEESLSNDLTGAISDADIQVIKFHGMYLQDDRDRRDERAAKKLERLYSFMIRLRLPGGNLTPAQWQAVHHIAGEHSTGVIKITTRQTLQLHGLLKAAVKPTIQAFDAAALDSIATCGDINRNVAASSHPAASPIHAQVHGFADTISQALMPKTRAYYEIWLDEEQLIDKKEDDPLYQHRYLPRKFKIGIAIPPNNDVDVFTNDIGLIAIVENDRLLGYNIAIGGGLSQTHGNADTYPRLASVIGFAEGEEKTLKTIYEILTIQRDYGNRTDRKLARLKYTVDNKGLQWWKEEIERRTGFALAPARTHQFTSRKDLFGWQASHDGLWHYTALVEHGRVTDDHNAATKTCLFEIACTGKAQFRFTSNQNVLLYGIAEQDKPAIDELLHRHGLKQFTEQSSELRKHSMACVAFNTCPLALAEAQRYLPALITKLEPLVAKYGLEKDETIVRMTGCPNGCGRSVAAEIGFIGTAYGRYNIQLGGDRNGERLNVLYKKDVDEAGILQTLEELFALHAQHRLPAETLGDFALRYLIKETTSNT